MEQKMILVVAAVVILLAAAAVLAVLYADGTPAPQQYTGVIVNESASGIFFDTVVFRFPAKAAVYPPRVVNQTLTMGLSTDTDKLDFGVVSQNQTVGKVLNFGNEYADVKTCVVSYGDISALITPDRRSFLMGKGDSGEIILEFSSEMVGNFTGEVDVVMKKPKYGVISPLLPWVGC